MVITREMLDAKIIQKYKKKTDAKLIAEAQRLVNAYVRKRDAINEYGDFICMACGELKPKNQTNAGHYFSRGQYKSVRFDVDNIWSCCIKCNFHLSGNLIPYRENLIKKIGLDRFEKLESLAHLKGFKYNRFILIDIIERFKKL